MNLNEEKLEQLIMHAIAKERVSRNLLSKKEIMLEAKIFLRTILLATAGGVGLFIFNILIAQKIILYVAIRDVKKAFNEILTDYSKVNEYHQKVIENYQEKSVLFMGQPKAGKTTAMVKIAENALTKGSAVYLLNPHIFVVSPIKKAISLHQIDIFKSIFNNAKNIALKNKKPSYILIDELDLSPLCCNNTLRFYFLKYLKDETYKENVKILATTNRDDIHQEWYINNRFDLEVLYTDSEILSKPYKEVETIYKELKKNDDPQDK
jgi:hypothetical protein